jgi:dinuclear metal center YbgI/SA1388 family protein
LISQQDVVSTLEDLAPSSLAEEWDNIGWQVRCGAEPITGVLCAVDATLAVLDEAVSTGANLVIAHHPLLFRPLSRVDFESRVGAVVAHAFRQEVSILAAHTNWDSAAGGISWALARHLRLEPLGPLLPSEQHEGAGLGVVAESAEALPAERILGRIRDDLGSAVISVVGHAGGHRRIALMGGSGSAGIVAAAQQGATLYITADVRYHEAQEAEALGLSLLVIDHGVSERPGMAELVRLLARWLPAPVTLSQTYTSPWRLMTDATD